MYTDVLENVVIPEINDLMHVGCCKELKVVLVGKF